MQRGRARKFAPKFVGPYRIIQEIVPHTMYKIALPPDLLRRGIHPIFHASLLRIHIPNDDRRFPARA